MVVVNITYVNLTELRVYVETQQKKYLEILIGEKSEKTLNGHNK